MTVLCIDSAAATPVAALLGDGPTDDRGDLAVGRAQDLLRLVDALLAGVDRASLDAVVVGTGPGGFTGLRVGVAMARGIAEALGIPLYGVSSLLVACALEASRHPGELVWAVLDARRGELFVQPFRGDDEGRVEAIGELRAIPVDALDSLVDGTRFVRGDEPSPSSLALAARQRLDSARAAGESGDPIAVVPSYGRAPDATPPRLDVGYDLLVPNDLDALLRLEGRCFDTPWTRSMYAGEFDRPAAERVLIAARDAGTSRRLLGAGLAARIGDSWHVMNVLVDPIARGRGIGGSIVEQLLAASEALGAGEGWTLEVRDGNSPAISLYERHGFTVAGRRRGYYADSGEDALVMWRRAGVAAGVEEPS